ncbi:hypothetical protein ASZ90_018588 [hydrocarbon metagenome]|uniref:Uncharacterized protein n=1 Tax=hydrocarbon metagenome TaxID=938273 RepID=A0A0W8E5W0_9ZZZZ
MVIDLTSFCCIFLFWISGRADQHKIKFDHFLRNTSSENMVVI